MTTITIIEDNLSMLATLSDMLKLEGYDVKLANQGQAGLEIVRKHLPDLVLCDIGLPELDGFSVLEALQEDPQTQTIPFIFLTARESRDDMRRGMELGAGDYITKPFSRADLLNAVSTQLRKKSAFEEQKETTLRLLRRNVIYALPHELRTPLALILGYSEIMSNDLDEFDRDTMHEMLMTIHKSGQRLYRLFENYLIYAQLELLEVDPTAVAELRNNLTKNAATVIETQAQNTIATYNRASDLHLELIRLAVPISSENLGKIVAELVDNACKFSQPGTPIQVTLTRGQSTYMLSVRDHGRGMTPEQIKNVGAYMQFERQLHEQQGLGLGLAITQRMVKLHSGAFNIASVDGQGTEITLEMSF